MDWSCRCWGHDCKLPFCLFWMFQSMPEAVQTFTQTAVSIEMWCHAFQVIEGSSIQFDCSNLQNNTNSVPAKTSSFCPGMSAVYYRDWTVSPPPTCFACDCWPCGPLLRLLVISTLSWLLQNSSFATATGGAATYAIYEQGLNHWSTTTTPYWARLPPTLRTSFSGR